MNICIIDTDLGYNPFKTHMNSNSSNVRAQIVNTKAGAMDGSKVPNTNPPTYSNAATNRKQNYFGCLF